MSFASLFNFSRRHAPPEPAGQTEIVQTQNQLRRILSFTGQTIDDVVNDPLARRKVVMYFKLGKWIEREDEVSDLERQWNSL